MTYGRFFQSWPANLLRVKLCIQHAGVPEERLMTTGRHKVVDVYCNKCMQAIGWKYIEAFEHSQKYKEGKYILERYVEIAIGNFN
mmetsp:Transcript_12725/g.49595  ORF Transcript_12725/g.49595 Transcript_12725/m.49595 type:complete len:85 (-) Transcript_12725:734-988(-)